ncbi:hypothetical protein EJB05_29311 [Eragrostis curvula]|uniref:Uncharacterized protein n=1 Tax=Eragrostis curvula TaxID=38414 RepID=A0A5J9UTZ9_9POAL|nr:hypothetical protein EJB05_29311 [Eragrostis curvula]
MVVAAWLPGSCSGLARRWKEERPPSGSCFGPAVRFVVREAAAPSRSSASTTHRGGLNHTALVILTSARPSPLLRLTRALPSRHPQASSQPSDEDERRSRNFLQQLSALPCCTMAWLSTAQPAESSVGAKLNMVYEVGELFELGIQLSYLLILLGLLGAGSFFVVRQVLVRRELDLSAKELQEQVRSGDASATEYFELGAVMLRRKFYPAAIKYLQQAIQKWDRDEQDLAQVYNALGVSYKRDNKLDKAIQQFEKAVELQPGYVTAWNNLGDAYEQKKDLKSALKAFEEVLLFDPNNKVARPRRDDLRQRVGMYKGVPVKTEKR